MTDKPISVDYLRGYVSTIMKQRDDARDVQHHFRPNTRSWDIQQDKINKCTIEIDLLEDIIKTNSEA